MAEPYREHNSGCSYWNSKFDPRILRGFLEQFYCSTLLRCAVWFPFLSNCYLRNFLLNWPLEPYFREEIQAVGLLNNFLLIHFHSDGPSPSGTAVQALMSVHSQLPELRRALPMAEGAFANEHLQPWLIITEKLRMVHPLYWKKKQWAEKHFKRLKWNCFTAHCSDWKCSHRVQEIFIRITRPSVSKIIQVQKRK